MKRGASFSHLVLGVQNAPSLAFFLSLASLLTKSRHSVGFSPAKTAAWKTPLFLTRYEISIYVEEKGIKQITKNCGEFLIFEFILLSNETSDENLLWFPILQIIFVFENSDFSIYFSGYTFEVNFEIKIISEN